MIVCTDCGHRNPDGTDFCIRCGRYLQWTGARVDDPPHSALVAKLPGTEIRVDPGGEAFADLEVRNLGSIIDAFDVAVVGLQAAWIVPEPAQVRLFPRSSGSVRLRLTPPRSPDVPAGVMPFTVQVTSATDTRVGTEEHGEVVVGAFRELAARLVPVRSEGVTSATHRLEVANRGNMAVDARVLAADPDEQLSFDVQEKGSFRLEPGAARVVTITISPPGAPDPTQPHAWPFRVSLEAAGEPPIAVDGVMVQQPAPAPKLTARLVPEQSEGVASATHRLEVANQGTAPVEAKAVASEPSGALVFDVQPPALFRMEPGAARVVTITVRPRWGLVEPQPRAWPFQVGLEAAGAPPITVDGVMVQQPAPAPKLTARLVPEQSEGVASATHRLEVANQGPAPVDARAVASEPSGALAFDVQPPAFFRLAPGAARVVTIAVMPRWGLVEPQPRPWPFQVSLEAGGAFVVAVDGVMVQLPPPAPRLTARLVPEQAEGVTFATYRLEVANQGSAPVQARVVASDPNQGLAFDVRPPELLDLQPGAGRVVAVVVSPRRKLTGPRPRIWSFQLRLEAAGVAPVSTDGILIQQPAPDVKGQPGRRRRGCGCWIALLVVLGIGAGLVYLAYVNNLSFST